MPRAAFQRSASRFRFQIKIDRLDDDAKAPPHPKRTSMLESRNAVDGSFNG
jgi:hypothetical protein